MLQPIAIDDKSYAELLSDSFALLPGLAPEWTDYNAHDPGVTILEMITWLTEMQRYHTAQITDRHRLQYLRLLGAAPRDAQPAGLLALLEITEETIDIPSGTPALVGEIPYSTVRAETICGAQIEVSDSIDGVYKPACDFRPFGDTPVEGQFFYAKLSCPLPPEKTVSLYVCIGETDEAVTLPDGYEPPAEIAVEVRGGSGWFGCTLSDGTCGLTQSGYIRLRLTEPAADNILRIKLTKCDVPTLPAVSWMSFRALTLIQRGRDQETLGVSGRVKEGLRFCLDMPTRTIDAANPFPSRGGLNKESIDEAAARYIRDSLKPSRAVSADDYRELVSGTPGLKVRAVNAYTSAPGRVCVCVHTETGRLTEREIRNLRRQLYPRKPACIQLEIRQPVYWEARLFADIMLSDWTFDKKPDLKALLAELYTPVESQFEAVISLSDWCVSLMRHPFIREVRELTLLRPNDKPYGMDNDFMLPPDRLLRVTETIISAGYSRGMI